MKRPTRVELYREICKKAGMLPSSQVGYFSRKEMMELLLWISSGKDTEIANDGKGTKRCLPKEKTV